MIKFVISILIAFSNFQPLQAQNLRSDNPNQENGYRATEAETHYYGGRYPVQHNPNGYRASEAGSHFAGGHYQSAFNSRMSGGESNSFSNRFQSAGPENQRMSWRYGNERPYARYGAFGAERTNYPEYAGPAGARLAGATSAEQNEMRVSAVRRLLRNSNGGFNRIYVGE